MQDTIIEIVGTALKQDPSVSPADRLRFLAMLRDHGKQRPDITPPAAPTPNRLLRRREVAQRLSCSVRAVDLWARQGLLPRRKLPGRSRSVGFPEAAVVAFIDGRMPVAGAPERESSAESQEQA